MPGRVPANRRTTPAIKPCTPQRAGRAKKTAPAVPTLSTAAGPSANPTSSSTLLLQGRETIQGSRSPDTLSPFECCIPRKNVSAPLIYNRKEILERLESALHPFHRRTLDKPHPFPFPFTKITFLFAELFTVPFSPVPFADGPSRSFFNGP